MIQAFFLFFACPDGLFLPGREDFSLFSRASLVATPWRRRLKVTGVIPRNDATHRLLTC